jgi:hypothetical protein
MFLRSQAESSLGPEIALDEIYPMLIFPHSRLSSLPLLIKNRKSIKAELTI